MKINTKTLTPINKIAPITMKDSPDSILFHPNKFIQNGTDALNNHEESKEDDGDDSTTMGSSIRYIATLIFTPVKASSRFGARPGTVDKKEMEELNAAFKTKCNFADKEENIEKEETKEEKKDETKQDDEENSTPTAATTTTTTTTTTAATTATPTAAKITTAAVKTKTKNVSFWGSKKEPEAPKEKLGRYKTLAITPKSNNKKVVVIRSYRLATDEE